MEFRSPRFIASKGNYSYRCIAAGKALAGAVSAKVVALTDAAVKSMLLSKLKVTATTGLVLAVLALGAGASARAFARRSS